VYASQEAGAAAQAIGAKAYTASTQIIFAPGHYQPGTPAGLRLLAHELAHVVQQSQAGILRDERTASRAGSPAEREADTAAQAAVMGAPVGQLTQAAAPIARQEAAAAPVNPEVARMSWDHYVDQFISVIYDLNYRSAGGRLSTYLHLVYRDGTELDIELYNDLVGESVSSEVARDMMANAHVGPGGRIFPEHMNPRTTPRLWAARESAIEAMEESNLHFMMATMPAVVFIITMPMAAGMGRPPTPTRTPLRSRPIRAVTSEAAAASSAFTASEQAVIAEARQILTSPQMAQIRTAQAAGQSITVNVGGRIIQFEPGLPASGMTMFGENGFLIGREAFASEAELTKTILHELHRLTHSASSGGVSGAMAASETEAAFQFAQRAFEAFFK
jgi:hypothetical protein